MPRAPKGHATRQSKNRWFKLAKGHRGSRSRCWRKIKHSVIRGGVYATRHRRLVKRDYRALFTSRDTFISPSLAVIYGVAAPPGWTPYASPADSPRAGLLTQVSFLAAHAHPGRSSATLRGKALRATPGGKARIEIKRINIAERLYRVTGQGIYRDSAMLGVKPPIEEPLLNAQVTGQDSVLSVIYRGKIHWFWGDTNKASYPLGNFSTTGATSEMLAPAGTGLDPNKGVNLRYFTDEKGFTKKLAPLPEPGPVWLDGVMVLKDDTGAERMLAHYSRMKSLGERLEHGLMRYSDEKGIFEKVAAYPKDAPLTPRGHPLMVRSGDVDYFHFASPYALERVEAAWAKVHDLKQYEAFTCLAPGSRYSKDKPQLDRDKDGKLVWAWKRDTDFIDPARQRELIAAGHIRNTEAWIDTREVGTNRPITLHAGSMAWNEHRRKFVMIAEQIMGTSMLGEIWYSEADKPEGPWKWAVKIVTHEKYSFYNPRHHPFFDQDGGRFIYFEGTYADLFSGAPFKTPRYDYNQMMYRLDLNDARLKLP